MHQNRSKNINSYKVAFVVSYGGGSTNLSTGYQVGNYVQNVKLDGKSVNFSFSSNNSPVEVDVPAGEHTLTWTIKRIDGNTINYTESTDTISVSKNCIYDISEYKATIK